MPKRAAIERHSIMVRTGTSGIAWRRSAQFAMVEQCLFQAKFTVGSISASSRDRQSEYARLSRMSLSLRRSGRSDAKVLQEAERLHPGKSHGIRKSDRGWAMYFIGKCLVNNNDPRATHYLLSAISIQSIPAAGLVVGRNIAGAASRQMGFVRHVESSCMACTLSRPK